MYVDKRDVVNKDDFIPIENVVTCPICSFIIFDPVQCEECQVCFCRSCIENWVKQFGGCPNKCSTPQFKDSRTAKNLLRVLRFRCKNNCGEEIPYLELKNHYSTACKNKEVYRKYSSLKVSYKDLLNKLNFIKSKKNSTENEPSQLPENSSSIKSPLHNHGLINCVIKDIENKECSLCGAKISKKERLFYCTFCDFKLCDACQKQV